MQSTQQTYKPTQTKQLSPKHNNITTKPQTTQTPNHYETTRNRNVKANPHSNPQVKHSKQPQNLIKHKVITQQTKRI